MTATPLNPVTDLGALIALNAAGAGTTTSTLQGNSFARGVKVVVNIAAQPSGSPTLTVTIRGYDPASGSFYTLLQSAALSSIATTVLTVYPGIPAASNTTVSDVLPALWDVTALVGGTSTPEVTATIGACVLA